MKFALFLGCKIPYFVPQYETSMRMVLKALEIGLEDVEFNCCGYPVRNLHERSYVLSSARILALSESRNLGILTPCKCCYGSLKKAQYLLENHPNLRDEINESLADENLKYEGRIEVKHLLSVLFHDVGLSVIKEKITNPYEGLKIATHYGCHALRPSKVVQFDDPLAPTLFDRLVEVTGAESVDWSLKLQCCGNPLWGKNDALSLDLSVKKLEDAAESGAHALCVACTYCQIQFDTVQKEHIAGKASKVILPSILYPQLLGLAMGMDPGALGMDVNKIKPDVILDFISSSD